MAEVKPPPPFADGTLVVHRDATETEPPKLGLAKDPEWLDGSGAWSYVLTYVQFPERGQPSGGHSFPHLGHEWHVPTTHEERWLAAQYKAAERVRLAQAELDDATAELAAVQSTVKVLARVASQQSEAVV